jgi:hypothetical protein
LPDVGVVVDGGAADGGYGEVRGAEVWGLDVHEQRLHDGAGAEEDAGKGTGWESQVVGYALVGIKPEVFLEWMAGMLGPLFI